jgi:hypothetical protein
MEAGTRGEDGVPGDSEAEGVNVAKWIKIDGYTINVERIVALQHGGSSRIRSQVIVSGAEPIVLDAEAFTRLEHAIRTIYEKDFTDQSAQSSA